jgi:hypothetical protein
MQRFEISSLTNLLFCYRFRSTVQPWTQCIFVNTSVHWSTPTPRYELVSEITWLRTMLPLLIGSALVHGAFCNYVAANSWHRTVATTSWQFRESFALTYRIIHVCILVARFDWVSKTRYALCARFARRTYMQPFIILIASTSTPVYSVHAHKHTCTFTYVGLYMTASVIWLDSCYIIYVTVLCSRFYPIFYFQLLVRVMSIYYILLRIGYRSRRLFVCYFTRLMN